MLSWGRKSGLRMHWMTLSQVGWMLVLKYSWTKYVRVRQYLYIIWLNPSSLGRTHSRDANRTTRVLSWWWPIGFRTHSWMLRSNQVSGDALQAAQREHQQGGARGLLPGSWNSAYRVSYCTFQRKHVLMLLNCLSVLQKHIKRQIISLNGGFRVIADLNNYYTFISSLRVC